MKTAQVLSVCVALVSLLVVSSAAAQSWDTFPTLPADANIGLKPALDNPSWGKARTCLTEFESKVDATYFAAVVDVSDADGNATPAANDAVPYVDALYQYWKPGGRLAPDKHILIVLALKNRAVAIHAGSEWTDLGFRRNRITETIDGSKFKSHARNGDYPESVCELMRAVDRKLASMLSKRKRWLQEANDQAQARIKTLKTLEKRVVEATADRPKTREAFLNEVKAIRYHAHRALEQVEAGRPEDARRNARAADKRDRELKTELKALPIFEAKLDKLRTEIDALRGEIKKRPDATWSGPEGALAELDKCSKVADGLDQAIDSGLIAATDPTTGALCTNAARSKLAAADLHYLLVNRALPIGTGLLILMALATFLLVVRRRRTLLLEQLDGRLTAWDRWLGLGADRVLAMEKRHPLYFGAGSLRFEGETEPLDRTAAEAVNHVFLLLDRAQLLARRARELAREGGPLSSEPAVAALELLTHHTVRIETGDAEPRRRIFLPLQAAYEGTAEQLLRDLDTRYGEAMSHLDTLNSAVEKADSLIQEIAKTHQTGDEECTHRTDLGLDAHLLRKALIASVEGLGAAERKAALDPVGATPELERILQRVQDVAGRARAGNDIVAQLRGPVMELGRSLRGTVARLRSAGFRLDEPGLAPDTRLDDRAEDSQTIVPNLDEGALEAARNTLRVIEADLQHLAEQLSVTEGAKDGVPNGVARALESRERIASRIPGARDILDTLGSDHDPATFQREADNLDELADVLGGLEKWRRKVTAAHGAQRYLEAAREVRGCDAFLDHAQRLLDELEHIQSKLNGAREHAKAAWHGINELRDACRAAADDPDTRAGEALLREMEELDAKTAPIGPRMELPKPNWLHLAVTLDAFHENWEHQRQQLEAARRAFALAQTEIASARSQLRELAAAVEKEQRDRPHVSEAVRKTSAEIDDWDELASNQRVSAQELLDLAESLSDSVAWADSVWVRELEDIREMQAEVRAARAEFAALESRSYGWGVQPRLSALRSLLVQLDSAEREGDLTGTMSAARRLRTETTREHKRCRREAEDEREARQLRAVASSSSFSSTSSPWSSSSSSSSAWSSSSSSSSSFSSSSSSSSSFSSSSGGSSFSSSSGGSSFSSSSGGGSFGSSNSGGSSW